MITDLCVFLHSLDYATTIAFALGPRRLVSTRSPRFLTLLRSALPSSLHVKGSPNLTGYSISVSTKSCLLTVIRYYQLSYKPADYSRLFYLVSIVSQGIILVNTFGDLRQPSLSIFYL